MGPNVAEDKNKPDLLSRPIELALVQFQQEIDAFQDRLILVNPTRERMREENVRLKGLQR